MSYNSNNAVLFGHWRLFDTFVFHLLPFSDIYARGVDKGINVTGGQNEKRGRRISPRSAKTALLLY